ncbi:condensation domain-containing protein [Amycolatopsis sp. FBCC-B4732]|uniref:condensation domain-containing protein n=1 Tax=Amycolatopsis sp. FBCC-B4732 TaxID=3079339 RepID=UPI001FF670BB|nr:condensation domain-containing protein [Amycolatopsis sp. FBCC-B4732]UOX90005.1 condensation domain-containing protein [Amycolatopsis sp. FBCC-B4732]
MATRRAGYSSGPTSLHEEERLSGEYADWSNLVLGTAWLTGELDIAAVREAWRRVCLRHDVMRRTYAGVDEARTYADPLSDVEFHVRETDAEAIELMRATLGVPFSLFGMGFSRIAIVRTGEHRHLVGIAFDHIITDELSWSLLMTDFTEFYRRAREAGVGAVAQARSYHDFAVLQRRELGGEWGRRRREFWRSYTTEFGTSPPGFSTRASSVAPPVKKVLRQDLPADTKERVADFARRARVTPFAVTASSVLAAMRELAGDTSVGLFTGWSSRTLPGTSRTVGLLVHNAPLHLSRRTADPLEVVREVFRRSIDLSEYGLPLVGAGRLWGEELMSPGAKAGVHLFFYDGTAVPKVRALAGTSTEPVLLEVPGSPRIWEDTISVDCQVGEKDPRMVAVYNENLFPGDLVEQLLRVAARFVLS